MYIDYAVMSWTTSSRRLDAVSPRSGLSHVGNEPYGAASDGMMAL